MGGAGSTQPPSRAGEGAIAQLCRGVEGMAGSSEPLLLLHQRCVGAARFGFLASMATAVFIVTILLSVGCSGFLFFSLSFFFFTSFLPVCFKRKAARARVVSGKAPARGCRGRAGRQVPSPPSHFFHFHRVANSNGPAGWVGIRATSCLVFSLQQQPMPQRRSPNVSFFLTAAASSAPDRHSVEVRSSGPGWVFFQGRKGGDG